jgi:farnesyl diphosphate synthase
MSLKALLAECQGRIETCLQSRLPPEQRVPEGLHRAMRYSTLDGGKRIRPVLVYASGRALGAPVAELDGPAMAVELIHAYSLIHDDLPAMDDDDLRRGKPTCHKAFDEATAILAGDALQSLAFEILAADPAITVDAPRRLRMVAELAVAAGAAGMCGGQAIDVDAEGKALTLPQLEQMHRLKTGALIRASVRLGALSAPGFTEARLEQLDRYAAAIGLAFQIRDDILDVEADTATLGKTQGSDLARNKPTYTSLLGLDGAKRKLAEAHAAAGEALADLGTAADPLRWIADYIVVRGH